MRRKASSSPRRARSIRSTELFINAPARVFRRPSKLIASIIWRFIPVRPVGDAPMEKVSDVSRIVAGIGMLRYGRRALSGVNFLLSVFARRYAANERHKKCSSGQCDLGERSGRLNRSYGIQFWF